MTELYPRPNEQGGGKGAVPVTNIDFFSRKSSLPTGSMFFIYWSEALPGVLGIQGEMLFIFRDFGRRVIYFQGFGEKA